MSSPSDAANNGTVWPLIPVGIDLGSLHARVSIGEPIAKGDTAAAQLPTIISNSQGSRFTVALSTLEEVGEETKAKDGDHAYVFGEAARRHLARRKTPVAQCLVRRSCVDDPESAAAFFAHVIELACDASTYNAARPSQLRIVLSVPDGGDHAAVVSALRAGVRRSIREREGKKSEKRAAASVVVGVVCDAAAAVLAYGLVDDHGGVHDAPILLGGAASGHTNGGGATNGATAAHRDWRRALVVDWGASGLTLSRVDRANHGASSLVRYAHAPACAGEQLTAALLGHCATQLERKNGLERGSVLQNARAVSKLGAVCETAIRALGRTNAAPIAVDGVHEGLDLNCTVSRPRFEMLCGKVLREAEKKLQEFVGEEAFDVVLLCGSVCQMPAAEALMRKMFDEQVLLSNSVNDGGVKMTVDESVAVGCGRSAQLHILALGLVEPSATEEEEESKQELVTEFEAPLSPVGIGILDDDDVVHTLITADDTPLPAHVSKVIHLSEQAATELLQLVQITSAGERKVMAEIGGIAPDTRQLELTLELSREGTLSLAVNGGETTVIA